jgi:hypothetical protein
VGLRVHGISWRELFLFSVVLELTHPTGGAQLQVGLDKEHRAVKVDVHQGRRRGGTPLNVFLNDPSPMPLGVSFEDRIGTPKW